MAKVVWLLSNGLPHETPTNDEETPKGDVSPQAVAMHSWQPKIHYSRRGSNDAGDIMILARTKYFFLTTGIYYIQILILRCKKPNNFECPRLTPIAETTRQRNKKS